MCGIAGICNLKEPRPISLEVLGKMAGALRHRGPDEGGIYVDDGVGLASARLSIIDLLNGTQPVHNEDKSLWVVLNGEIFNYVELRQGLLQRGHLFYTLSDTEVILHLYEEKGALCLEDLNGQFAFAVWNVKERKLFLARDRVGIHPLHYAVHDGRMVFASEAKAIFAVDGVPRSLEPAALDQIFTFWTTLPGATVFQGIREVPPGHYLECLRGNCTITRYWDIPFHQAAAHMNHPISEIVEEVGRLLTDSVRIRLRADVPVGCYLSGGLDSTGLTALVKGRFQNRARTFGIRFEEAGFDEGSFQNEAVRFLQTEHEEARMRNEDIGAFFWEALWYCEKPILRTAPVPLFLLSRRVNQCGLKVVLTGEGADEVFGGYNIFREAKIRRFWARQPESLCRPALIRRLYPYIFSGQSGKNQYFLKSFFKGGLDRAEDPLFSHLIRWENTSRIKTFFSKEMKAAVGEYRAYDEIGKWLPESYPAWDCLSRAQYLEMILFMSNYLLSCQGDRMAMAHGVEIRPPYLDHRILEFMGRVPPKWKILGLDEKHILKRAFQGLLPENILRRPKHPYRAPIGQSLLQEPLPWVEDMLSEGSLKETGLFDVPKVEKLLAKVKSVPQPSETESMALAGILSSQAVHRQFIADFPRREMPSLQPSLVFDHRSPAFAQKEGTPWSRKAS